MSADTRRRLPSVDAVVRAAGVIGVRSVVIENTEFRCFEIVERQRLSGIAPEQRIVRHLVCEGVEIGRGERPIDRRLQVAPASANVVDLDGNLGRDLLHHAERQVPAVLACVPAAGRCGINRER